MRWTPRGSAPRAGSSPTGATTIDVSLSGCCAALRTKRWPRAASTIWTRTATSVLLLKRLRPKAPREEPDNRGDLPLWGRQAHRTVRAADGERVQLFHLPAA